jgi:hypothetical protein
MRRIAAVGAALMAAVVYVWITAVRAVPAIRRKKAASRRPAGGARPGAAP